jgi:polysaccharide deacetylase family protein (PEP-CTERM system associated)
MLNGISVDLEDWYQGLTSTSRRYCDWCRYEDRVCVGTQEALGLLRRAGVRATFFVLGYVAEHYPDLVLEIRSEGHEIATHGYRHRLVYEMTEQEFRDDVSRSLDVLSGITGETVHGHRAAAFSVDGRTPWAFSVLESLGLRYDSSVVRTKNPLYGWPAAPRFPSRVRGTDCLLELPVSTLRLSGIPVTLPVGGGFYVRAYPLKFTLWAIRRINSLSQPAILYFHPWELDPGHPRPACVTLRERISHYHNLDAARAKWSRLLEEFPFGTLASLALQTESSQASSMGIGAQAS